jgi:hypothetical protein
MNSQRHTPRPQDDDDVDPRWWYVPTAVTGTALLVALAGFIALPSSAPIDPAAVLSQEFPILPAAPSDSSVPDAAGGDYARDSGAEPPATF